jgi:hypothetical protein
MSEPKEIKSLLELAKEAEAKLGVFDRPGPSNKELQEMELALAYHRGEVHCGAVANVMGFDKTAGVSAWFSSVVMKGVRSGAISIAIRSAKQDGADAT